VRAAAVRLRPLALDLAPATPHRRDLPRDDVPSPRHAALPAARLMRLKPAMHRQSADSRPEIQRGRRPPVTPGVGALPGAGDGAGASDRAAAVRKSRWPARMDLAQSLSGLALGLFMWGHMFFVSSILLGHDAMWVVTKAFEGYFFFGRSYPLIVSVVVAAVASLVVLHAALAMRKFPASWRQLRAFDENRRLLRHGDTSLWWVQVLTGFALFFLAFPHLYQMLMHPGAIGPYESSGRVFAGSWWPLYLVLLFAVELHGGIGLYRLALKWGWLQGSDPATGRRRLKQLKWGLTAFFLVLGLATLAAYLKIGYERRDEPAGSYVPAWVQGAAANTGSRP
jgi:fumarate reductase subunit C